MQNISTSIEKTVLINSNNADSILLNDILVFQLIMNREILNRLEKKSIEIVHNSLFRPKLDRSCFNMKMNIASLNSSLIILDNYISSLPICADLHVEYDTLILESDTSTKWAWKSPFELWINDVYKYNIEPSIYYAGKLPVLLEYARFKSTLYYVCKSMPCRWKKKYGID